MMHELEGERRALIAASAVAIGSMPLVPLLCGFSLDLMSFVPLFALAGVLALFLAYVTWRRLDRLRPPLEATVLGLLVVTPILAMTYAAMRADAPLADSALIAMDRALGFDWPAFVRLVDRSAALSWLLGFVYSTFVFQLLAMPWLLGLSRRPGRAYEFVLAYLLLCALSAVISVPFPSLGAYVGHQFDAASLRHLDSHFAHFFLDSFLAVRERSDFVLAAGDSAGIITFPSVHAGVAAICAWAAWPTALRYPALALNLLMALSAIPVGAHYLVDVIAGGFVALATVWIVRRLIRLTTAPASSRAPALCQEA